MGEDLYPDGASAEDLFQAVREIHPTRNPTTIRNCIKLVTVNHPSRVAWQVNHEERLADSKYDRLFKIGEDTYIPYAPEEHGLWRIVLDEEGNFCIQDPEGQQHYSARRRRRTPSGRTQQGRTNTAAPASSPSPERTDSTAIPPDLAEKIDQHLDRLEKDHGVRGSRMDIVWHAVRKFFADQDRE